MNTDTDSDVTALDITAPDTTARGADTAARIAAVQDDLVARFTQLCGDPDDTEVAAAADRALLALDALLEAREPS